jgi:hypothetical protein
MGGTVSIGAGDGRYCWYRSSILYYWYRYQRWVIPTDSKYWYQYHWIIEYQRWAILSVLVPEMGDTVGIAHRYLLLVSVSEMGDTNR